MIVVTAATGPWGVEATYNELTNVVGMTLIYHLTVNGLVVVQPINLGFAVDEVIGTLSWEDEPRVANALAALGYELP